MSKPEFVSLHTHTEGSVLDGFSKVSEYLARAKDIGQNALGVSDHGDMFKIYDFLKQCQKDEMIGIPGIEMYMAPINPEGAKVKKPVYYGQDGKKAQFDVSSDGAYLHLSVWATTLEGLHNLFKLSTLSFDPERYYRKPRIDFDLLEQHSEGLVVSTGCPSSEISTRFMLGQDDKAYEYAGRLKEVFGDERLFIEIMNHDMGIDLERTLLPKQIALSKKMGLKLLATNDSHYAYPTDALHHEEMLCMQSKSFMSVETYDNGGRRFAFNGNQYYLKSAEEMAKIFPEKDYPGALSNTLLVAEMAQDLVLPTDPGLKPNFLGVPQGETEVSFLQKLLNQGYKKRYGTADPEVRAEAKRRVKYEFDVINSLNFVGYFLVVWDYLEKAKREYSTRDDQNNILALPIGVGRGSVGGSIVAYLLGISELDPIKHDLLFERFLSAGRGAVYQITYTDGSTEELMVSDVKNALSDSGVTKKYIHELNVGDKVEIANEEDK